MCCIFQYLISNKMCGNSNIFYTTIEKRSSRNTPKEYYKKKKYNTVLLLLSELQLAGHHKLKCEGFDS